MGYSPCFLVKNDKKSMFFASAKVFEINLKGVKISQNRSKPWAIWHTKVILIRFKAEI
jgi:hypothetical protein